MRIEAKPVETIATPMSVDEWLTIAWAAITFPGIAQALS